MFDSVSYIYILYYSYPAIIMWLCIIAFALILHPFTYLICTKKQSNIYLFLRMDGHMTACLVTFLWEWYFFVFVCLTFIADSWCIYNNK